MSRDFSNSRMTAKSFRDNKNIYFLCNYTKIESTDIKIAAIWAQRVMKNHADDSQVILAIEQ